MDVRLWWLIAPLWFIFPCWAGNVSALLARKLPLPDTPIDFGMIVAKKPLFGPHKTWRGIIIATIVAGVVGLLQPYHDYSIGALLGLAAMLGDLAGAAIKRRLSIASGQPCLFCDRILDTVFPIIFASLAGFLPITFLQCVYLIIVNIFISKSANMLWYVLRLKEHPW